MAVVIQPRRSRFAVIVLAVFVESIIAGAITPITGELFDPSDGLLARQFTDPVDRDLALAYSFAIYPVALILLGPLVGRAADSRGRRPIIIAALLMSGMGNLVSGLGALAGSPLVFCIGRTISSGLLVAIGVFLAVFADIAADAADRVRTMGWAFVSAISGAAIGFLGASIVLAAFVGTDLARAVPYLVLGLAGMVNALAVAALLPETLRRSVRVRSDTDDQSGFWVRGHGARLVRLSILHLGLVFAWTGVFHVASDTILRRYGVEDWQLAAILGVSALLLALFALFLPPYLRRTLGYGTVIGLSGALMGLTIMGLAITFIPVLAAVMLAIFLVAYICQEVPKLSYVAEWAGDSLRGRFLSFFCVLSAFATGASYLASGALQPVSDIVMLSAFGLVAAMSGALAFGLPEPEPPRALDPEDVFERTGLRERY